MKSILTSFTHSIICFLIYFFRFNVQNLYFTGNDPSSSSNTTMDLDINKLDISQLDAILVKYKWNPNEKEIDEGTLGGKSKSDAGAM